MFNLNRLRSISRRNLIKVAGVSILGAGLGYELMTPKPAMVATPGSQSEADESLKQLMDGNRRYISRRLTHPHQTGIRIREISASQYPFAVVLGCSDSRVAPEILFDQGLGDLFVIRVAGNILDDAVLGSIEYAAEHLKVPLVMVLGHERCGAVQASLGHGKVTGHLSSLVSAIRPVVERVKEQSGDPLENAVRANVKMVVEQIKTSPVLAELVEAGKLRVVGSRYDLDQGAVEIIA
jgi:carbonic anhydrase